VLCAQARASGRARALEGGRRGAGAVGRREGVRADSSWGVVGRRVASASLGAGDSRPTHPRVRALVVCPR
jgi:hypothetical protein